MRRAWLIIIVAALALPAARSDDAPGSDEKVGLELRDAPLQAVLKALAAREGKTLVLPEEMSERVSLSFNPMPASAAFDQLLDLYGYKKEVTGTRTVVTRRVVVEQPHLSEEAATRLYFLARVPLDGAVAGIASITSARAVVDRLPGDRELLVTASSEDHALVKAWIDRRDAPRYAERVFRLVHHEIAKVDTATAAARDPVAREVQRLLTPAGTLDIDPAANSLHVCDEAAALERVAGRIAELDRAPARIALEAAIIQQPIGTPIRGFIPMNELPAAFCDEGSSGPVPFYAYDDSSVDALVSLVEERDQDRDTTVLDRQAVTCEERSALGLSTGKQSPSISVAPRLVGSTVEVVVTAGDRETRIRLKPGRAAALRGLVKVEKWRGGWGDAKTELVLVVRAVPEGAPPPPSRPAPAAHEEKLPPLALPGDWDPKK